MFLKSGVLEFGKSISRPSIVNTKDNPNDNRFNYNSLIPEVSTRAIKYSNFKLNQYLNRDSRAFFSPMTPPSNNIVKSLDRIGKKAVVSFNKMKGREPMTASKKPHTTSVDTEKINKYYDKLSTVRRIITPQFNAYKPRYSKDQVLPSFMEKINSRTSLTTQNMEMFKSNGFLEGNFQTILSSFKPKEVASPIKRMRALTGSNGGSPVGGSKLTPSSSNRIKFGGLE